MGCGDSLLSDVGMPGMDMEALKNMNPMTKAFCIKNSHMLHGQIPNATHIPMMTKIAVEFEALVTEYCMNPTPEMKEMGQKCEDEMREKMGKDPTPKCREWMLTMSGMMAACESPEGCDLLAQWNLCLFDCNGDNMLDQGEFMKMCCTLHKFVGCCKTEDECKEMFLDADKNKDGSVDIEEFKVHCQEYNKKFHELAKASLCEFKKKAMGCPMLLMGKCITDIHPNHVMCFAMTVREMCKFCTAEGGMKKAMKNNMEKMACFKDCMLFMLCDSNGDNCLDMQEWAEAIKMCSKCCGMCEPNNAKLMHMWKCATKDADDDSKLTMCEWKKFRGMVRECMMKTMDEHGEFLLKCCHMMLGQCPNPKHIPKMKELCAQMKALIDAEIANGCEPCEAKMKVCQSDEGCNLMAHWNLCLFDCNGDGMLDKEEFCACAKVMSKMMGCEKSDQDIEQHFFDADKNNDGFLDLAEFQAHCKAMAPEMHDKMKQIMSNWEEHLANPDPDCPCMQMMEMLKNKGVQPHEEHKCCLAMCYNLCQMMKEKHGGMKEAMQSKDGECCKGLCMCFIFALCDSKGRNWFDMDDFKNAICCVHKMMPDCPMNPEEMTDDCWEKVFGMADCNGDGKVTMCEWKKFCCMMCCMMKRMKDTGEKPSKEMMMKMMEKM